MPWGSPMHPNGSAFFGRVAGSDLASPGLRGWAGARAGTPSSTTGYLTPGERIMAGNDPASPLPPVSPQTDPLASPSSFHAQPAASAPMKMPTISSPGQGIAHIGQSIFDGIEDRRQDDHRLALGRALLNQAPDRTEVSPQLRAMANLLAGTDAGQAPAGPNPIASAFGLSPPSWDDQVNGARYALGMPLQPGSPAPAEPLALDPNSSPWW